MSGFLRKAAFVVGAVALVAATGGAAAAALAPGIAGTASIAGISAATLTAIGTYGGLAAGVLSAISAATAPGLSAQGSQTSFTTNPQSGLPYAMGRTRMSGLRIYAATNTRPGYTKFNDLLWFGAMLSIGGQIQQIERFTADGEVVTFDTSGNAIGTYHDYQAQKVHLGGPQASALALSLMGGTAPGWSTQHRLSGITHAMWCLRFNKQGEMYGAGAPEPAWIGKWVRVYDPRLDSTYPGGSGTCRALDETTYVWSDNPAIHALTWALGRWQNGRRTCGIGAPVANIRVAEFVECANVCEANGWKVGGVEWTTDSKWDTLKRILQAGGAVPTQTGAMIGCLVSAPRSAIATIESRHLLDSLSIAATKSRRDRFNTVIPRYVDEDSDWSVISGTAIKVPDYVTADRGQRTKEIDYPLVQVFSGQQAKQPGQLAAYDIVNSREAGPINFTTGPEWIGLKTGDVVLLNVPEEGLVDQPVLITRRAPDPSTGKVSFSAETETYSKHAFALGQTTTPPAPFTLTAPDLKPPAPAAANWSAAGTVTGEGLPAVVVTGNSEMPSADAVLIDYRKANDDAWTRSAILSANDPVQHVIAPLESETPYQVRVGYRVEQIDGLYTILAATTTGAGIISDISDQVAQQDDKLQQLEQDTAAAEAAAAAAQTLANQIQASVTADIDALSAEVTAAGGRIHTVETTLGEQGATITNLQATVSNQAGTLATHDIQISTASAAISTNAQAITAANQNVAQLTTRVGSAESAITSQSTALTNLTGRTATLESTVTSQGASITQLQSTTSTLQGDVASITTRVTAGTGNLCPNPTFENGLEGWSFNAGAWAVTSGGNGWGSYASTGSDPGNGGYLYLYRDISIEPGSPYTLTADMGQFISGGTGVHYTQIQFLDASNGDLGTSTGTGRASGPNFDPTGQSRQALKVTASAPAGTVKARIYLVWYKGNGTVQSFHARQVQLERGTVATAFSQQVSILQSFQALSTLATQYASLSTTVQTQGVTISTQQTAITQVQGNITTLFGRWGLEIDVNGYVSGMVLNNNGQRADLTIRSDRFRVLPPGGNGADGFYVDIDAQGRTTQYILSGGVRVAEFGWCP